MLDAVMDSTNKYYKKINIKNIINILECKYIT